MPPSLVPTALLLAGGQGSRLGGRDKGLMPFGGEPVAAHLGRLLRALGGELLISCNRNQAVYAALADRLVVDEEPDFPGPLAGILAGLRSCHSGHMLVLACDMSQVDLPLLQGFLAHAAKTPQRPCMVRTGDRWQPLLCVIPQALLPQLEAAWQAGQRSPLRWLLAQQPTAFELPAADPRLHNGNCPADWTQG
ncbi:MAG: molybdenum cofactor guanylyltransferase MobA [Halopseudomonas sp.]|uniref:molybdenum cofactor guanylyltransferase MobA n=1 Tax=Halopseudomonas sp. TaxID=2901191 RepID=UPI00300246AD